ncbi:hypothetical protein DPMN_140580 [Dreissena polymorpha]|uniref:Uncharacterized protein n=1 Tax=Dreissena polymorpha TaxID=45954 RepID=A0A9D4GB43_DREPO|nr:hypothetical protein DPMN_140580 [Dreissena polymorpha]
MTRDYVHGVGHSPVYHVLLQSVRKALKIIPVPSLYQLSWNVFNSYYSDLMTASIFHEDLLRRLLVDEGTFRTKESAVVILL